MFGFEDNLLLKLASVLNLFTANNMQEKFRPVHVSWYYTCTKSITANDSF